MRCDSCWLVVSCILVRLSDWIWANGMRAEVIHIICRTDHKTFPPWFFHLLSPSFDQRVRSSRTQRRANCKIKGAWILHCCCKKNCLSRNIHLGLLLEWKIIFIVLSHLNLSLFLVRQSWVNIRCWKWKVKKSLSHVRLFVTPWSIQSMECSRPKYWSG